MVSRTIRDQAALIKPYEKLVARLCLSLFLLGVNAPAIANVLTYDWHQVEQHAHEPGHDRDHPSWLTDDCDSCCYHGLSLVGITPSVFELLTDFVSLAFATDISSLLSLSRAPPIPPPNIHIV